MLRLNFNVIQNIKLFFYTKFTCKWLIKAELLVKRDENT